MPDFIAYYRVSTDRQGASGLELQAQRTAILQHIGARKLAADYTEVESGKKHTNRPQLLAALQECRRKKAHAVIAKLDRLGHNAPSVCAPLLWRSPFAEGITLAAQPAPVKYRAKVIHGHFPSRKASGTHCKGELTTKKAEQSLYGAPALSGARYQTRQRTGRKARLNGINIPERTHQGCRSAGVRRRYALRVCAALRGAFGCVASSSHHRGGQCLSVRYLP